MQDERESVSMGLPEALGGVIDTLFLTLPKIARLFKKPRQVTRQDFEAEMDFYFREGFVQEPAGFFTFPEAVPDHEIAYRRPIPGGEYQVVTYRSLYQPWNPLVRDRYASFPENRIGCIVRWTHGKAGAKTVLCSHGYLLGNPRQAGRMFKALKLFQKGLDVALFITPFHWRRRPAQKSLRGIFLQPEDPAMTCECFGQAIFDLASTFAILKALGAGRVGLIGASLGGYLTALFASLQDTADFAAMMVPAVDFTRPVGPETAKLPFPLDEALLDRMRALYTLHSPLRFTPKLPRDRLLIVASRGDLVCPFDVTLELCRKWGWPEHHFLRGGHWLMLDARERGRSWYSFLDRMGFM